MQATINSGNISGTIAAPPSKSVTQRAFAGALLHKGKTVINNAGRSRDDVAALSIIRSLGASVVEHADNVLEITSNGISAHASELNCNESGLCARLFTPIAALASSSITIKGEGNLLDRPMYGFNDVLPLLGVSVSAFNGFLPCTVQGPLQTRSVTINAESGSQFLSGLLFALSSCAQEPLSIKVSGLKSKPYIDLTLDMLKNFGRPIVHHDHEEFYIDPALFTDAPVVTIDVEADWSSAAYLLVAGAISGSIAVTHLNVDSAQADRAILNVLEQTGAHILIDTSGVTVAKSRLRAFEFDATHCPDLFPVLAVLAACCDGESEIKGLHRLFHKESNRAESISEMLENFAVPFSLGDDSLFIRGVRKLQGTVIDSYHDHRIAMAAAIAALRANSPVDIIHAEAVNKSYPAFFDDLLSCGVKCNLLS